VGSRIASSAWLLVGGIVATCSGGKRDNAPAASGVSSAAATAGAAPNSGAGLLVQKGCPECHAISALGIKAQADVGPDLTLAYSDVQTRYGVTLEEFLPNPTGTMQLVFSQMTHLTSAERDSVVRLLKALQAEHDAHQKSLNPSSQRRDVRAPPE